jgi:hypothetical protein
MSEFKLPSLFLRVYPYWKICYSVFSRQELAGIGSDFDLGRNMLIRCLNHCLTESLQDIFLDLLQI